MHTEDREWLQTTEARLVGLALSARLDLLDRQSDAATRRTPEAHAVELAEVERIERLLAEVREALARTLH